MFGQDSPQIWFSASFWQRKVDAPMALRLLTLDLEKVVATHVAIIIIITTIIIIINWDRWEHHPPHLPTPPRGSCPTWCTTPPN